MRRAVFFAAAALAVFASAGEIVTARLAPCVASGISARLAVDAAIGNAQAVWRMHFKNLRAHGNKGRRLHFRLANGCQRGFSSLIGVIGIQVNGISWEKLQFRENGFEKWSHDDAHGVQFTLNFDGAPLRVRFWMEPDSPLLRVELAPSPHGQTPIDSLEVRVSAIPSYLACGSGKQTRFFGYRRQLRTERRLLPPRKHGREALPGDERLLVFEDADWDGSAEGKGDGPSALLLDDPVPGTVMLNDSWTTDVILRPDPSRPFRFSLLEYPSRRLSNGAFRKEAETFLDR